MPKFTEIEFYFFFGILWQLRDRFLTPEAHSLLSCPRGEGGGCIKEVGSSSGSKLKKSDTFGARAKEPLSKVPLEVTVILETIREQKKNGSGLT